MQISTEKLCVWVDLDVESTQGTAHLKKTTYGRKREGLQTGAIAANSFKKEAFRDAVIFSVFLIQNLRIHMFLGLLDPDPLVTGMDPDPDPSIIKQK